MPLGRPEGFNRCVGRPTLEVIVMQAQYVLPLVDISKLQSPDLADRIEVAH
ncbi:isopenicillin N synthase family oxygenase, partial [Acinetobacter radioresistens]